MRPPFSWWQRLRRAAHYRLVVPLKRSRHPPEYTARAVAIGLFWGFTPTVGIQMYLVLATWLLVRRNPRFDFAPIVGIAWTWTTNVITMWPIYYVFYVTGRLMMGDVSGALGYDYFVAAWQRVLAAEGMVDVTKAYLRAIVGDFGLPMTIGSIPYAFGSAWLGYRWTLKYLKLRHERRRLRLLRARAALHAKHHAAVGHVADA